MSADSIHRTRNSMTVYDSKGGGSKVSVVLGEPGLRRCGDCQLCCKLLPTQEIAKPAGEKCPNQKHGVGCKIYARRPASCAFWACRWLVNDDTADLSRPDRSRYVIDTMPDYVTLRRNEDGASMTVQVIQIWCDPKAPDAWRDPALLAFLERRGKENIAALVRFDNKTGIGVFPPTMAADGQWHEYPNGELRAEHSMADKVHNIARAGEWMPRQDTETPGGPDGQVGRSESGTGSG